MQTFIEETPSAAKKMEDKLPNLVRCIYFLNTDIQKIFYLFVYLY